VFSTHPARRWPPWPAGRGWDRPGRGCRPDSSGWSGAVGTACWAVVRRWATGRRWFFVRAAAVDFGILGFMFDDGFILRGGWYILMCVSVFCKLKEADLSCYDWWA
jgi:hypothetical protein